VNLQSTSDAITLHYLAAASVVALAPVVIIFILLQRYIVSALTSGAIKG
jgi:multiple sugar transport system permease protein